MIFKDDYHVVFFLFYEMEMKDISNPFKTNLKKYSQEEIIIIILPATNTHIWIRKILLREVSF